MSFTNWPKRRTRLSVGCNTILFFESGGSGNGAAVLLLQLRWWER